MNRLLMNECIASIASIAKTYCFMHYNIMLFIDKKRRRENLFKMRVETLPGTLKMILNGLLVE